MKNSFHNRYATDKSAEQDGQWVGFGDNEKGGQIEIKIRSSDSDRCRDIANRLAKRNRTAYIAAGNTMTPKLEDMTHIEMCATAYVADWRGVLDEKGNEIPYSVQAVREMVTEYRELRKEIIGYANMAETFRAKEVLDAMAGNSPAPSVPSSEPEATPIA